MKHLILFLIVALFSSCHFFIEEEPDKVTFEVDIEGQYAGATVNCNTYPFNQLNPPIPFRLTYEPEDVSETYLQVKVYPYQIPNSLLYETYTVTARIRVNGKVKQETTVTNGGANLDADILLNL